MFFITNAIDGYKKAFCYKGVADRKTYFFFTLFQLLADVLSELSATFSDYVNIKLDDLVVLFVALSAVLIYMSLASIASSIRRLHDIGLSGWFIVPPTVMFNIDALNLVSSDWYWFLYVVSFSFDFLLALPKSKIENNKYRPADSISIPATDEAVS